MNNEYLAKQEKLRQRYEAAVKRYGKDHCDKIKKIAQSTRYSFWDLVHKKDWELNNIENGFY